MFALPFAARSVCFHSNLISDGSELLLLIPNLRNLIGPIFLPILGAVPDGAIVAFSGTGDNAQEQLAVGIGALAGSSIMLLTLPVSKPHPWPVCDGYSIKPTQYQATRASSCL